MKLISNRIRIMGISLAFLGLSWRAAGAAPEPSTEQLLRWLIRSQAVKLDIRTPETGCEMDTAMGPIRTLGEYLAHLIAALEQDNGKKSVASACRPAAGKPGWDCAVWFSTGEDGESPWRYGIQFQTTSAGTLDRASLRCPGGS